MDTNPQQSYEWMRFSDLSKLISLPEWQRLTSEKHISEIYKSILSYTTEHKRQPILPGCLTLCNLTRDGAAESLFITDSVVPVTPIDRLNQTFIMIDGQHRFLALKKLYHEHNLDIKVMCCIIKIRKEEEAHSWFSLVNSNLPLTRLPSHQRLTVPNQVAERIVSMYPKIFSEAERPRRPHIRKQELASQIALVISKNPLLAQCTPDELETKLLNYNRWMSTQPPDSFKYPGDDLKTLTKYMSDIQTKKVGVTLVCTKITNL